MAGEDDTTTGTRADELFLAAVRTYADHYRLDEAARGRVADPATSRVILGPEPTVVLVDAKGVPLGTVAWLGEGQPTFEPPTRITVVDHVHKLRPDDE